MKAVRVYFGFRSPYSRLGLHKIARAGLDAQLIPFTGPPQGSEFFDPMRSPAKLGYYREDVLRMTVRAGLPLALPDPFEVDYAPANRAFVAADRAGAGLGFALGVSDARWGQGRDISRLDVLEDVMSAAGLDRALVRAAQDDPSLKEVFASHRALIEQDGVFGVPFAATPAGRYWGQDRFDIMLEEL